MSTNYYAGAAHIEPVTNFFDDDVDSSDSIDGTGKNGLEKVLKKLLIVASVLLVGEMLWLFIVNPLMPFKHVEINAISGFDRQSLLALAGIQERSSFYTTNVQTVKTELQKLPTVSIVTVEKIFPDTIKLRIEERVTTALCTAVIGGKTRVLNIDKSGVVFKIDDSNDNINNYILLSGINVEPLFLGAKLPQQLLPLLSRIDTIQKSAPELLQAVSELHINRKENSMFDLLLYMQYSDAKVRVNPELTEEILRSILLLLDVLKYERRDVDILDFRSGTASYILK
jgi:cell division septal protein FtsQ